MLRNLGIKEKITIWVEHKGYLQLGVTIQNLSREIGINRTYLSNYINETYQSNFNGWLNDLRIEEAKQKIISSPEINLSDLVKWQVLQIRHISASSSNRKKEYLLPYGRKNIAPKVKKINILHFCRKIHNYIQIDKQERSIYAQICTINKGDKI